MINYTQNLVYWANMRFTALDAPLVLQAAITNNTAVPEAHASSYARVVPLMMATILGSIAVLYGFYCNRFTHKHALQWINAGLVLACTILIAVSFGYTYHQYTTRIQAVCNHTDLIQCTDTRLGVEFILLVIGVCLSALAFLFWAAPSCFHFISSSAPTTQTKKQRLSSSAQEKRRKSSTMLPGAPADPLAAWREASLISEAESASMMEQKEFYQYDTTALPPPPPNSHHHYYYQDEQLVPPSRPYVPQRASPSSSRGRRTSQASGNTFGADYRLRYSRSSSITLEDDPRSEDGRLTTPTSLTPRPTAQDEYFCITPIDNTSSSIRSQSPSLDPRRRSSSQQSSPMPSHVPELSHPPPTRHPLNRKVITDERISAYLQQRRQQGSQSS